MDSKVCSKCGLSKSLLEFYIRKKHREGEYYERCKECFKERGRKYYHSNHERQLKLANLRNRRTKDKRRILLAELKDRPCADCGKKYPPWVMDFDHREDELKIGSISRLTFWSKSKFDKILLEINKCDLVCANCHRQRTYDRIHRNNAEVANVVKASA